MVVPLDDDVLLSTGKHLRLSKDVLDLRELRSVVELGIVWWEQQVRKTEGVARKQAADAIKDLSLVLDSLSQQLAQGRDTVRITTSLPTLRRYSVGCPVCGHGNRKGARFCLACGSPVSASASAGQASDQDNQMEVVYASLSDVGQKRSNNEDTCFTGTLSYPSGNIVTLLLVADGMGGAKAGEEASRLASETFQQEVQTHMQKSPPTSDNEWQAILDSAVCVANQKVHTQSQTHADQHGMGTTLTALVVDGPHVHLAHVGDSRAYLVNPYGVMDDGTKIMQLTNDHTLVARLVDIGQISKEEARLSPQRSMLYRALGTNAQIEVDTQSFMLKKHDVLVVCSDGLTTHVEDTDLSHIVLTAQNPERVCHQLVALANQRGGRDNISVVVARLG